VLLATPTPHAFAQAAPGYFADANHPAGAPDPEKLDAIWSVDPISDQVSIRIPFTTTPQGGRGPKLPFALLYNSASTITLMELAHLEWDSAPLQIYFSGRITPTQLHLRRFKRWIRRTTT
jgi:hypothetical protein